MGAIALSACVVHTLDNGMNPASTAGGAIRAVAIEMDATVDSSDTVAISLADVGITTLWYATGFTHSTTDSVVITEEPTTSVSSGTLTWTVGGATANKKRVMFALGV